MLDISTSSLQRRSKRHNIESLVGASRRWKTARGNLYPIPTFALKRGCSQCEHANQIAGTRAKKRLQTNAYLAHQNDIFHPVKAADSNWAGAHRENQSTCPTTPGSVFTDEDREAKTNCTTYRPTPANAIGLAPSYPKKRVEPGSCSRSQQNYLDPVTFCTDGGTPVVGWPKHRTKAAAGKPAIRHP